MMRIPSYLQRHSSGIFYFRIVVPDALKSQLNLREIKCSLRTRFKHEAIFRSQPLSLTIRNMFGQLAGAPMEYKDARVLLQRYLDQKLAAFDLHFEKHGPLPFDKRWTLEQGLKKQRNIASFDLPSEAGVRAAQRIAKAEGLKLDPNSEDFQKLATWATKMFVAQVEGILAKDAALAFLPPEQRREAANEALLKDVASGVRADAKADARQSQGAREAEPEVVREVNARQSPAPHQPSAMPAPQPHQPATSAEPTLSSVLGIYTAEKLKEGSWTDKTQGTAGSKHDLLVRIIGDVPIRAIGTAQARDYKQVLQQLPKNINTKPLYRSKTIQQILTLKPDGAMSVTTINNYLAWASTFFDWAERNGYVDKNPFRKLQLKNPKRPDEARAAYTMEDLQKIFSTDQYREHKYLHPHYYWLPLLGLHTGARLNELCQLYAKNVRQVDGLWVLDINEAGPDQRIKTAAARRLVPIHPKLIELGFVGFVDDLWSKGETRLFPELKPMRDGAGQAASKWFARYRKPLGLYNQSPKKDFHSFRTTLINELKQKGHPEAQVAAVVGHATQGLTYGTYGKAYAPSVLITVLSDATFGLALLNVRAWKSG
jgi:integrase